MEELNRPEPHREPIQGLWIGTRLSTLEQLTIRSFQRHGHPFHLYTYNDLEAVPEGTLIFDAEAIIPASKIFKYQETPSYAGFANLFRYKLLYDHGGWWVDMDTVCLRPFDFAASYVFGSEDHDGGSMVVNGIMKAPPKTPVMKAVYEIAAAKKPETLKWGETGPRLLASLVERFDLRGYAEPPSTFCPVPWQEWRQVIEGDLDPFALPTGVRALHMWNEMWRREGRDKDAEYRAESPYERLKRHYL